MSFTIWDRFEANAARQPDKAALIYYHKGNWKTVTYAELLNAARRFVSALSIRHITPGMRVALLTPPSADFFALAFALLKLGIVPIIIDPAIGLNKLSECLKESKPDIFIGNTLTHGLRMIFGWGKKTVKHNLTVNQLAHFAPHPSQTTDHSPLPTDPAAIIYTSGSTGIPKGALYTQANLAAQMDMLADTFKISTDEIDLPAFPLYALIDVLLGVTSVIPDINFPVPKNVNPAQIVSAIQEYGVTNTFASPIVLEKLAAFGLTNSVKLPSLKRVITAGAPATIQLQEKFRKLLKDETDLFGIYGATEVLPIAKIESREIFEVMNKTANGAGVCLGKPVKGTRIRIIQINDSEIEHWQDSLEVGPNVVGEITVKGAAVTGSYIAREAATRMAKIKDGDDIVHRMGDVGYFDEQGRLWYCGRKSHRVITEDDILFTEQIEGIFNAHPSIYRSALVGVNRKPVLWVELEQNERIINQEKIIRELMGLASDHPQASRIKTFLFMKRFPTDVRHNSKIIREELTMLAERRQR